MPTIQQIQSNETLCSQLNELLRLPYVPRDPGRRQKVRKRDVAPIFEWVVRTRVAIPTAVIQELGPTPAALLFAESLYWSSCGAMPGDVDCLRIPRSQSPDPGTPYSGWTPHGTQMALYNTLMSRRTVTAAFKRLVDEGWIVIERHPQDRRRRAIFLTHRARQWAGEERRLLRGTLRWANHVCAPHWMFLTGQQRVNFRAAILLARMNDIVVNRYTNTRKQGKYWWYRSYAQLARDTGMNERVVEGALRELRRDGLIETMVCKNRRGERQLHFRTGVPLGIPSPVTKAIDHYAECFLPYHIPYIRERMVLNQGSDVATMETMDEEYADLTRRLVAELALYLLGQTWPKHHEFPKALGDMGWRNNKAWDETPVCF